jgi:hypothetical protein
LTSLLYSSDPPSDFLPHTLAVGIERDRAAVIVGITLPWNSGVVEGFFGPHLALSERSENETGGAATSRRRCLMV